MSRRQLSTFERRPSQRYGPRQSLVNRREQIRNDVKQQGIFPNFIPVLFQVAAAAGLAIPDLVSTAQSSRPCPDKRVIEESRIAHEPPSILGARPNPRQELVDHQKVIINPSSSNGNVLKQLNESPSKSRRPNMNRSGDATANQGVLLCTSA
ncbi:unnamed protein product [Anisakis simplex]|uniref:Uncharacterized protein n=1 Tax=Anisakis simplex TaxID=6269 RepID=A0A3P6NCF2_ANISI|nr:unnamed protein product [Anisakis simplex]